MNQYRLRKDRGCTVWYIQYKLAGFQGWGNPWMRYYEPFSKFLAFNTKEEGIAYFNEVLTKKSPTSKEENLYLGELNA